MAEGLSYTEFNTVGGILTYTFSIPTGFYDDDALVVTLDGEALIEGIDYSITYEQIVGYSIVFNVDPASAVCRIDRVTDTSQLPVEFSNPNSFNAQSINLATRKLLNAINELTDAAGVSATVDIINEVVVQADPLGVDDPIPSTTNVVTEEYLTQWVVNNNYKQDITNITIENIATELNPNDPLPTENNKTVSPKYLNSWTVTDGFKDAVNGAITGSKIITGTAAPDNNDGEPEGTIYIQYTP